MSKKEQLGSQMALTLPREILCHLSGFVFSQKFSLLAQVQIITEVAHKLNRLYLRWNKAYCHLNLRHGKDNCHIRNTQPKSRAWARELSQPSLAKNNWSFNLDLCHGICISSSAILKSAHRISWDNKLILPIPLK